MIIKNYTLFANGGLHRVQFSTGDWSSCYAIDSIRLKNNNTKKSMAFTSENEKKLMKSIADAGYSKSTIRVNMIRYHDGYGSSLGRQILRKKDWKHIVDATGGILKIWLTNTHYDRDNKRIHGDIVLFKESKSKIKTELARYETQITERFGKVDGRFHDFSKAGGYQSFTHHLEMEKQESDSVLSTL